MARRRLLRNTMNLREPTPMRSRLANELATLAARSCGAAAVVTR